MLAVVGLSMADLFPKPASRHLEPQREHVYTDESGTPVYRVCKLGKKWAASRPDPSSESGWSPGIDGIRRVLYRLPELVEAWRSDPVWCCEGERDADTAATLGMVGTAAASNGWRKADLTPLQGRRCVVICDQDPAGHRLGRARAAALRDAGALLDDDDIVWPRSANDLTDLVARVELDRHGVPDVNEVLEELRPIPATPPGEITRSIEERASPFAIVPREVLKVGMDAQALFFTLDVLAGDTRVAKLTITAFAKQVGIGPKRAADAFRELEEANLIHEIRRGTWRVENPIRRPMSRASGF